MKTCDQNAFVPPFWFETKTTATMLLNRRQHLLCKLSDHLQIATPNKIDCVPSTLVNDYGTVAPLLINHYHCDDNWHCTVNSCCDVSQQCLMAPGIDAKNNTLSFSSSSSISMATCPKRSQLSQSIITTLTVVMLVLFQLFTGKA